MLERLSCAKYPLYLLLMELSAQLRALHLILAVHWLPRDENEEADALTNGHFGAFSPDLRLDLKWKDLAFLVLPGMLAAAADLFRKVKERELAARTAAPSPQAVAEVSGASHGAARMARRRGSRLRDRDPW